MAGDWAGLVAAIKAQLTLAVLPAYGSKKFAFYLAFAFI